MKKILLIILIVFSAFIKKAEAQSTGVPDTLAYLQTIVANKAQYIGQPFSLLLNNLQISIKFFNPIGDIHHDTRKETRTYFSFFFPANAEEIYLTYPSLVISWQPYLDNTNANSLYTQFNGGAWVPQVVAHYSTGIIADIRIRDLQ